MRATGVVRFPMYVWRRGRPGTCGSEAIGVVWTIIIIATEANMN